MASAVPKLQVQVCFNKEEINDVGAELVSAIAATNRTAANCFRDAYLEYRVARGKEEYLAVHTQVMQKVKAVGEQYQCHAWVAEDEVSRQTAYKVQKEVNAALKGEAPLRFDLQMACRIIMFHSNEPMKTRQSVALQISDLLFSQGLAGQADRPDAKESAED